MEQYEGSSSEESQEYGPDLVTESLEMTVPHEDQHPIDWGATMAYIEALFGTKNPTDAEVHVLSQSLTEMYPGDAEAITALTEMPGFFSVERDLEDSRRREELGSLSKDERKEERRRRMEMVQRLTEYQFLLTDLIVRMKDDAHYLGRFWESATTLAHIDHSDAEMAKLRDGVLSQVAIYHLFEELGKHPRLSHPKEDAFNAIDLWTDDHQAIQVKGAPKSESFAIVPAHDTVSFPGVSVTKGARTAHYNSYITQERAYLRAKLDAYAKETHQDIEGFLMVIPRNQRDPITGAPDATVVAAARAMLSPTA